MPDKEKPRNLIERGHALVTVVAAIVTAWGGWITIQINQINSQLSQTRAERDWTATIFDKYADAVTRERLLPEQRIATLTALVNLTELIERPDLRLLMNKVIRDQLDNYTLQLRLAAEGQAGKEQAATQTVIAQAEQAAAVADRNVKGLVRQGASLPVAAGSKGTATERVAFGNYDFDIFWCEGAEGAEALANRVAALRDADATGRWRVRMLPAATNQREGYRVAGFEIRINEGNERKLAEELARRASEQQLLGPGGRFAIRTVGTSTPWYLSVFICP